MSAIIRYFLFRQIIYGLKIEVNRAGRNKSSEIIQPTKMDRIDGNWKTDSFEFLLLETVFVRLTSETNHRA